MKNYKSIFIISILVVSLYVAGELSVVVNAASEYDFEAGDLSGSFMADISNINYTDLGAASILSSVDISRSHTLDQAVIRAAFSIRAAVILMDAYDSMWEQKLGTEVFTGVPGTTFTSANWMDFKDYFLDENAQFRSAAYITHDGNATLNENSYRANVGPEDFDTSDYDGLNSTEVENLDTMYSDLTVDLLETDEEETDASEEANDMVVAGFKNLEATILEILKKRVANDDSVNVPASQIRIDNYTLTDLYHEQIMSQNLADRIIESYDEGRTAGFLASFRARSPLKFSRVGLGQDKDVYKQWTGTVTTAGPYSYDALRGATDVTTSLAFKKNIPKGTVSTQTGIKEKIRVGFSKITEAFSKLKSGTKKLIAKATAWFNGLSTKAKAIMKWGLIAILVFIVAFIVYRVSQSKSINPIRR